MCACVCVCVSEVNPPHSVSLSAIGTENATVCWQQLGDHEVDAYHIQLRPHPPSQERFREFWVNSSDCITFSKLVPGETYDAGVATERGGNRSVEKTLQLTLSKNRQYFFYLHFCQCYYTLRLKDYACCN